MAYFCSSQFLALIALIVMEYMKRSRMEEEEMKLGSFEHAYNLSAEYFVFTCVRDLSIMTPLAFFDRNLFWSFKYRFLVSYIDFMAVLIQSAIAEQIYLYSLAQQPGQDPIEINEQYLNFQDLSKSWFALTLINQVF